MAGALLAPAWAAFAQNADAFVASAWPQAAKLTASFPFADAMSAAVNQYVGQREDTMRYLIGLLLSYPIGAFLGLVVTQVGSPALYHALNLATGVAMAMWVFGPAWTVILAFAGIAYAILLLASFVRPIGKVQHALMMAFCMTFMTVVHLYRLHVDYMGWTLDVSGPCMILTIKLTSLAFNVVDGVVRGKKNREAVEAYKAALAALKPDDKEGRAAVDRSETGKKARLAADFLAFSVDAVPDPLAFFGFVFSAPMLLAGPAVEYRLYHDAAHKTDRPWGSRIFAGLSKAIVGLVFFGLTAYCGGVLPRGSPTAGDVTLIPNSILAQPWWYRTAWTWVFLMSLRFKYYGAWKLSEGAANMAGIGYTEAAKGTDGNWEAASNMDVIGFETAPNMSKALLAWNQRTQAWLGRYVNKRVTQAGSLNMLATYTLSALWHGFYPGYYLTFLSAPLFQQLDKAFSSKVKPAVDAMGNRTLSLLYDVIGRVAASLALNYTVLPFQALGWSESIAAWAGFSYAGHFIAAALYVAVMLLPSGKAEKGSKGAKAEGKKNQ